MATQKFTSFVELHIEEGPIPEAEGKTVGVVDSGQGVLWYDGKITVLESHAGVDTGAAASQHAGGSIGDRAGSGA